MDQQAIIEFCKEAGCCDACCLRFLGLKSPTVYGDPSKYILKFLDKSPAPTPGSSALESIPKPSPSPTSPPTSSPPTSSPPTSSPPTSSPPTSSPLTTTATPADINLASPDQPSSALDSSTTVIPPEASTISVRTDEANASLEVLPVANSDPVPPTSSLPAQDDRSCSPPAKRRRPEICVTCLGILQEWTWPESVVMVKEMLDKKRYERDSFAVALSAPLAATLRERALALALRGRTQHDYRSITPLKEAWKWSFGIALAARLHHTLDSGATAPLLVTLTLEYPDEVQELEVLKSLAPGLFSSRSRQKKRFAVEFTRRSVELALDGVSPHQLAGVPGWSAGVPFVLRAARCVGVGSAHAPLYLGGRYVKLSRELPQTPWLVGGERMMESSVQEIIFQPLAEIYGMSPAEAEHRLKFMSAGREDVDVRCLGDGRPFAVEVTDPRRELSAEELRAVCAAIGAGGAVRVRALRHVCKEELTQLKKGEETKCKTYEALCIKLAPADHRAGDRAGGRAGEGDDGDDESGLVPVPVTPSDLRALAAYRNTPPASEARVLLQQKTPLRVLHRRPLLARTRRIYEIEPAMVPGHPCLFTVRVRTEAGTYVKEWVHSELGRTRPALHAALPEGVKADILALDVCAVHLHWPETKGE